MSDPGWKDKKTVLHHYYRLQRKYQGISRDEQTDYPTVISNAELLKDKISLRKHWKQQVSKSPKRVKFWNDDVSKIHWLGFFNDQSLEETLRRYVNNDFIIDADLSCVGYVHKDDFEMYKVGLVVDGEVQFAAMDDLWTEFLDSTDEQSTEYYFENFNRLIKTPNLIFNPNRVIINREQYEFYSRRFGTSTINEVILSDWNIEKVLLNEEQLSPETLENLINILSLEGIEYSVFDNHLSF